MGMHCLCVCVCLCVCCGSATGRFKVGGIVLGGGYRCVVFDVVYYSVFAITQSKHLGRPIWETKCSPGAVQCKRSPV